MCPWGLRRYGFLLKSLTRPRPSRELDNYLKMPALPLAKGSTSSVAGDSHGNIWVAERCGANDCAGSPLDPVLEFDPQGNFIKSFGAGQLLLPHFIFIDKQDHIWIASMATMTARSATMCWNTIKTARCWMTLGKCFRRGRQRPAEFPRTQRGPGCARRQYSSWRTAIPRTRAMPVSSSWIHTENSWRNGAGTAARPARWIFPHCLAMDSQGRLSALLRPRQQPHGYFRPERQVHRLLELFRPSRRLLYRQP